MLPQHHQVLAKTVSVVRERRAFASGFDLQEAELQWNYIPCASRDGWPAKLGAAESVLLNPPNSPAPSGSLVLSTPYPLIPGCIPEFQLKELLRFYRFILTPLPAALSCVASRRPGPSEVFPTCSPRSHP